MHVLYHFSHFLHNALDASCQVCHILEEKVSCSSHYDLKTCCRSSFQNHFEAFLIVRETLQGSVDVWNELDFDCVQLAAFHDLCPDPIQTALFPSLSLVVCNCIPLYLVHKDLLCNPCIHVDRHNIAGHSNLLDKDPILHKILCFVQDILS